jgi:hypothetical protein
MQVAFVRKSQLALYEHCLEILPSANLCYSGPSLSKRCFVLAETGLVTRDRPSNRN